MIAVDWSGALQGERRKIWIAEARAGRLQRLSGGRNRRETIQWIVERAQRDPNLIVGFDFAFCFPSWYLDELGAQSAFDAWARCERLGEAWLRDCPAPFWGRPCKPRHPLHPERPAFRLTECESLPLAGISPKSVFQIGGAGSVGTGSIRGMPWLTELRKNGFAVDPFDAPKLPLALEIYPRNLTGSVKKSSAVARSLYLSQHFSDQAPEIIQSARDSDDAFDAAVSALCMDAWRGSLQHLSRERRPQYLREGRIWHPVREPQLPPGWPNLGPHALSPESPT